MRLDGKRHWTPRRGPRGLVRKDRREYFESWYDSPCPVVRESL